MGLSKRDAPGGNKILLRGGTIITMDPELGDVEGDIALVDGRIAAVGGGIDGDFEIVDARDYMIIPGLIDTHRHSWHVPMRYIGTDWDLPASFLNLFRRFGPKFRAEDVYASTLFARLSALDAGITTMLDWAHIQNTPDHTDENVRALKEAGGRSVFGHGQPADDPEPWMFDSELPHLSDIRRVRADLLPSNDGLVTLAMAARGPEFTKMDIVEHDLALARELDLRVTIHIGFVGFAASGQGKPGISHMHERGLLGPDLTFVHCCRCSDHEFHLLKETGGTTAVSAQMAMLAGGFGIPATGRMVEQGLRPSLSVDSETTASGDLFSEMRAALNMERSLRLNNLEPPQRTMPQLTARDVLSFATIDGANTLGLGHVTGSLTPGKSADLVMLPKRALNLAPVHDCVGSIVTGGHAGNCEAVFVAGEPVKWAGEMVAADTQRALDLLDSSCAYLYAQVRDMQAKAAH